MTEIQKSLLELLKEIDTICRKYNIEYYSGGGTRIGALRHGGFLPWDDDADVHMSRENLYKFLRAVEQEKPENRKVVWYSQVDNMTTHPRYVRTDTTLLLRNNVGTDAIEGQFVDIFLNYPLPRDPKKRNQCIEDYILYKELKAKASTCDSRRSRSDLRRYYRFKLLGKLFGINRVMRYLEKKIFYFKEAEAEEWLLVAGHDLTKFNTLKKDWGTPRYVDFETMRIAVPEYAEKRMNLAYGPTWFEIPKYKDRGEHTFITDLEIPYTVYTAEYHKRLDVKQFFQQKVRRKDLWFKLLWDRNVVMPRIRELQGLSAALELQNTVENHGIDLKAMVAQGRERELEQLFAPYLNKIYSEAVRYYDVYIDLPDEYLYAAFFFRCFNANYAAARRALRMRRERVTRELSPDLRRLCDLCDATDALLTALYGDLDLEQARRLTDEWLAKEPKALYFLRADIYLRLNGFGKEPTGELLRRCNSYMEQYMDDGELMKYKGDLLIELGKIQEAEKCYRKALCNLRNGYCVKEIKEYFKSKEPEVV